MNNDFLRAAASYYGMNPDTTATDWQNDGGAMLFTFSIHATEDDMAGILQRMKVMREEGEQRQHEMDVHVADGMSQSLSESPIYALRQAYDALSPRERSPYGSFDRFVKAFHQGNQTTINRVNRDVDNGLNRKVEHINAPEDTEPTDMRAVWIPFADATTAQRNYANDSRPSETVGTEYLVQWAMLTEEQKAQAKEQKND